MHKLEIKSVLTVEADGSITGLAWPFGTPDRVGDVIEKGAFASAAVPLPMLSEHDAKRTIGVWNSIVETARGLEVKGQLLIDEVQSAREVHALVKAGAVTGLSIGFSGTRSSPRAPRGRNIKSLSLQEISLVSVPCHPGARIASIKSHGSERAIVAGLLHCAAQTYRNP